MANTRLRHIIVGTDFSVTSESALERATQLAREHRARLTLAHVVPGSLWEDLGLQLFDAVGVGSLSPEAAQHTAYEQLQRRAAELDGRDGLTSDAQVAAGRPANELARIAAADGADLLVVGAYGEHAPRDILLGTTAQKLLRVAPCPVLVVKRRPPFEYQTILAPTDFSVPSRSAIKRGLELFPSATLHLAHAFELPYDGLARYAGVDAASLARYHRTAQERLHGTLLAFANEVGVAPKRRVLHVSHGHPPLCIERWIEGIGADLVVIAAHGKSELEATFLGSVSLHTVLAASCDVLLLRGENLG